MKLSPWTMPTLNRHYTLRYIPRRLQNFYQLSTTEDCCCSSSQISPVSHSELKSCHLILRQFLSHMQELSSCMHYDRDLYSLITSVFVSSFFFAYFFPFLVQSRAIDEADYPSAFHIASTLRNSYLLT